MTSPTSDAEIEKILKDAQSYIDDDDLQADARNEAKAALITWRNRYAEERIKGLFPEYASITNPDYSFIINKNELDAALDTKPAA